MRSLNSSEAYQTVQRLVGCIGVPSAQLNASANAWEFDNGPLTRNRGGECGSTVTSICSICGVASEHQVCAKATKRSWSFVRPSTIGVSAPGFFASHALYAV